MLQNRKLRHLQGIAVRNLVVTPPSPRTRRKTIDDEGIPNTLQTPAKTLAIRENRSVHHSRSTTDLTRAHLPSELQETPSQNDAENTDNRRDRQRVRRRSTLPWTGVNPLVRQTRLEDIVDSRMADTFFSMHCDGIDEPVYISEVVEKAMNPTFKSVDLGMCGPAVSRRDNVTLRFWARTAKMEEWFLLIEMQVWLRGLQYIGKTLESFRHPMPANCVIFQFADGVYASLTDVPGLSVERETPKSLGWRAAAATDGKEQATSSYDALMKLANLDDCIQDALATREKLEGQINELIERNQGSVRLMSQVSQAQERLSDVKKAVAAERKRLRQSTKRRDDMLESLKARREAMAEGRQNISDMQGYLSDARTIKQSCEDLLKKTNDDSTGQVRRICEDLSAIYPVEPIPGKPLSFTILNIPLPNSNFDDITTKYAKDSVAAALGYTAHLIHQISYYISVPLLYPIKPYQSTSYIQDPISVGLAQRTFPLYPVNTHYRFEYAVFLLNKDIEYLMNRLGLRVLDIRHTLANLKYLLYMLTAGTSELPARKAGGVRGLVSGTMIGGSSGVNTPSLASSRRGSVDSARTMTAAPSKTLAATSGNQNQSQTQNATNDKNLDDLNISINDINAHRFHAPSPPPHKLNGDISSKSNSKTATGGRGWQVGRDGQAGVTTMSSGATATAGGFIQ